MTPTRQRPDTLIAGRYRVCDIVVDVSSRSLLLPEGGCELTPRVFELLLALLAEPHTTLGRDALFERVWGTTCLEDSNLTQGIFVIRKALGDARKQWVKTLPKIGYRFEPPGAVVFEPSATQHAPPSPEPMPLDAAKLDLTPLLSRPRRGPIAARMAIGLLVVLMAGIPGAGSTGSDLIAVSSPAAQADGSIAVVLVDAAPAAADPQARRAALLLREWLRWKLSLLPSVVLVEEEDLIAGRDIPTYVIDLSVAAAPNTTEFAASGRIRPLSPIAGTAAGTAADASGESRQVVGSDRRLSRAVDAASSAVLAELLPARANDRWPALGLEAETAMRFADAMTLLRRDPPAAIAPLQAVVDAAPNFGPARIGLARALQDAGRLREAGEHAAHARMLSVALPTDAAAVLAAEADALSPTRAGAAAIAYARLHATYPTRAQFLLGQAQALLRANQPEQAMHLLAQPEWQRQPLQLRIPLLAARAEAAFLLGYHDQAREAAAEAIAAIDNGEDESGDGWLRARGDAQLMLARAHNQQNQTHRRPALCAAAADTFQRGGYRAYAQIALFFRAAAADDLADAERRMTSLTATLHANGDHRNELRVLRSMAEQYAGVGRRQDARAMRLRALRLAERIGDEPTMQLLDLDLLGEDLLSGDLDMAERRVERLRENRLWTKYRFRVARLESLLLRYRGRHRDALAALDRKLFDAERSERPDVAPGEAAMIACARMNTLLSLGELRLARAQLRGCRNPGWYRVALSARLGEAWIAHYAGDFAAARGHGEETARLLATVPQDSDYGEISIDLARLMTRLGDHARADALYRDALAQAQREAYPMRLAVIDTGLAELAAARGEWNAVERLTADARRRFPQRIWHFDSRLQLLEIARLHADGRTAEARGRARALADYADALGDAEIGVQATALAGPVATALASRTDRQLSLAHAVDWLRPADARIARR